MKELPASENPEDEVAALLEVLRATGRRLEELMAGEVDTAADPEGRMLLLRGTREQMNHNEVERQAAILNALPANIALLDPDGIILSVNEGWRHFGGANAMRGGPGRGVGVGYLALCDHATGFGAEDAHAAAEGIRAVLNGTRGSFSLDYECNASANERWFQLSVNPLSSRRSRGVVMMHRNISASKRDQSDLVSLAERLSLATEVAKIGVWEWDIARDVVTWDAMMFAINGFPMDAGMTYERWAKVVHPEDLAQVEATLELAIRGGSEQTAEFRILVGEGEMRYVSAAEKGVIDGSGQVSRLIGVNVDITERKRADEALRANQRIMTHQAEHDFLTDLPNQRVLRTRLEEAIARASRLKTKVAVLSLDLDGFKNINDSLGHALGDKLLLTIAHRLVESARDGETVCRFGGDEFLVLLTALVDGDGAASAAERMLEAVAALHLVDQLELEVTASIGISVYPDDGIDGEALIKNADAAMYQAKAKGGSNFQFFQPDMTIRAVERQFIEQNLRRALERGELALHYQPKYELKTRGIMGVEALLRWCHPVRGFISPATFIPIAEDCGLILPIGMWVVEEACRQARTWLDAGLPRISVAVNVSGRQFQSERFEEKVMALLQEYGIEPAMIELEVTESLLMKSPELTARLLQSLRQKGLRVAIDDFGTGYSSLSYLRRFPIDSLKIDQSFVRQMDVPEGVSMVRAIIHLGRDLNLRTIAEGVETQEEATILESMGCDRAQGYFFSRPLPPAQVALLLEQRATSD